MSTKDLFITDREKVRKEWGKNASEVKEYIQIIREWMKTQKHLPEISDDNMIEFVLTNCKYSIEKTKQNLDMYYTIRSLIPEFFKNIHPTKSDLPNTLSKVTLYVPLPKLTSTLHRVSFVKYIEISEDIFDPHKVVAHGCNLYEVRLHEDLVMGEIFIIDAKGLSMSHILKITPAVLKKYVLVLEKVWSNRLKEIHCINYPPYIDKLLALTKIFLKKKLYDRIHLHPNIESLYKHIPRDMLPSDYGGNEKSIQELSDLWQIKFKECEKRFDALENMEVNESLRPEVLTNSDVLGYYGNFKKIDVD